MAIGLKFLAVSALLASWLATTAPAAEVGIPSSRDNTLFEDANGSLSNGAGPVVYAGNNGQGLARRGLMWFDVASALPNDAVIEQATLAVHVSNAPNAIARTFTLHRVLEAWGEGVSSTTSGSGTAATTHDATWIHTDWPDQAWSIAGGTFLQTESATCSVADIGFYSWTDPRMADDIRAWLDDPSTNHGWLVLGDEVTLNTARRFDSRENAVPEARPVLVVRYHRSVGVSAPSVVGFSLGRAAPNPASHRSVVAFSLPRAAATRLEVRDVAGREVARLVEGWLAAGRHSAVWNMASTASLAAGIYYFQLTVDGHTVATTPVVRLK